MRGFKEFYLSHDYFSCRVGLTEFSLNHGLCMDHAASNRKSNNEPKRVKKKAWRTFVRMSGNQINFTCLLQAYEAAPKYRLIFHSAF